jgi:autotransporter-associated beta strand protein
MTLNVLAATNLSTWVFPGVSGRLLYQPDALGNRLVDASGVGYQGGTVPLPTSNTVLVKATVSPIAGDNTANIQNAINTVSAMPLDPNGFRGAVLLSAGTYPCSNTIKISASGVVLRGVGSSTNGTGTVLQATASNQYSLVQITGSGSASTVAGTTHNITNRYVPVGARSFNVDSISGLALGDHVFVRRVATSNWIHDIGMDFLTNPWTPDGYNIDMDRVITRIEGNRIFIDSPVTCAIDAGYTNGTIRKFTWSGRITNSGIEHIYGKSDYFGNPTNENHGWIFVQFNNLENGWARDLVSQYFGYACVALYSGSKCITVSDCQCLDPISIITGGRRYAFVMDDDTLCLVRNCYTRQDRHQFVTQSLTTGPNVFVDGLSDNAHAEAGPHHRWATAAIWDNVVVHGNNLDAQNTCESGTGHGWEGANCAIWNSMANSLVVASPPGARNWLIGSIGSVSDGSACHGIPPGPGTYDSSGPANSGGTNVFPDSLYFTQLQDRLAAPGMQTREYWLGEIDQFSNANPRGESVPLDTSWSNAVQAVSSGQALDGFDLVTNNHWIPFTFNYALGPGEHIVGATLSLAMRTLNSASSDALYFEAVTNGQAFSSLGWLPIATGTNATVRVLDLANQINLLTNGQCNLAAQGDIGIDWALLDLKVAPNASVSTSTVSASADATVRAGTSAANNFGSGTTLTVRQDASANNIQQAYVRWDLSGVAGAVYQARVVLTPVSVPLNGVEQGVALANSNAWTESGITWNNQPGAGERFATWIPGTNTQVSFDVTPQVVDALTGDKQLSLQLFSITTNSVDYASREFTNVNSRPQLLISQLGSPPTISDIADRTIAANTSTGPIPFTISGNSNATLTVTGTSSDQDLVPQSNIVFGGNGTNRTVTVTPAPNHSGIAVITVTLTDPGGLTASDSFTLTVSSHPASVIVWNGTGPGQNAWSTSLNWNPNQTPEFLDDVKFFDPGATGVSVSNINNAVDLNFGGTIASLQYGNTNGNHTTLLPSGTTLTLLGANGLTAGTETDNGTAQTAFATITGSGGTLELSNPAADLIVRQGTANSGGSQRATLDMSGLGNFVADIDQVLVGFVGPVNRATGTLYLGKTNIVTATGSPGICAGDSASNTGGPSFIYLGQTNAIFADSITIARQKATATLKFNPAFPNPAALFRGADGSSRIAAWNIADNSLQSTSSSSANGTNDFATGTVDALIDMLIVGKSQKTTGASSLGVLTFNSGVMDINTLQIGFQAQTGATSAGVGQVTVNTTNATLIINSLLELGHTSGGAGTSNTFGTLSINGGSVYANAITAGAFSGTNAINMNGGTLNIGTTAGSASNPLNLLTMTNSRLELGVASGPANVFVSTLITGGASNVIDIASVPAISSVPAQFTLIRYSNAIAGAGNNFVPGGFPPGAIYTGYISNNASASTLDLVITSFVVPDPFLTWDGDFSGDWDADSLNWKNNVSSSLSYAEGSAVVFNDTATGATNVNLTDNFTPASVTVSNNNKSFIFSGIGSLSGSGGLLKEGSGTFILDNVGSNDFTGGVTISAGALQIGNNDTNGNVPDGAVVNNSTLMFSRTDALAVAAPISGSGTLLQAGSGSLLLNGANSFSGSVVISSGTVVAGNTSALGAANGPTLITNQGSLDVNGLNLTGEPIVVSGGGPGTNGAIINSGPQQTSALRSVTLAGDTVLGGTSRWDIRNSGGSASLLTGGQAFSLIKKGTNQVSLVGVNPIDSALGDLDIQQGTFAIQTTTTQVGDANKTVFVRNGATLNVWGLNATPLNKRIVVENSGTVWNESGASVIVGPILLTNGMGTFNVGGTSLTLSNGIISGPGGITKIGSGTLNLAAANPYNGSTYVNVGTLALVGNGAIAGSSNIVLTAGATLDATGRADQKLTLENNQQLSGNGTVSGSLLANPGSLTSPGSAPGPVGALNVSGTATLQGVTWMEVTNNGSQFDTLIANSILYGGTLVLSNLDRTHPFVAANNFKLFIANSYSGVFTNIMPPAPGAGLIWYTNNLVVNGSISISNAPASPGIAGLFVSDANLVINGTNNSPGGPWHLLGSSSFAQSLSAWIIVTNGVFDANGKCSITNPIGPGPQQFYILRVP